MQRTLTAKGRRDGWLSAWVSLGVIYFRVTPDPGSASQRFRLGNTILPVFSGMIRIQSPACPTALLFLSGPTSVIPRKRWPHGRTRPSHSRFQIPAPHFLAAMTPESLHFLVWKMGGLPCRDVIKIKGDQIQKASHVMPRSQKMLSDLSSPFLHPLLSAVLSLQVQEELGEAGRMKPKNSVARRQILIFPTRRMTGCPLKSRGCSACELPRIPKSCAFPFRTQSSSFSSSLPILAQGTH